VKEERKISLSDQSVSRLKRLADPLDDTYDSVISRLLDYYELGHPPALSKKGGGSEDGERGLMLNPLAPPNLTHTKVTNADLAGSPPLSLSWNGLLDRAVRLALGKLGSFEALREIALMNVVEGKKVDDGYHFLRDVNVSVQGQDANDAWRATAHIAGRLGLPVRVVFVWRTKDGAAYPGETGIFKLGNP